MNKDMVNIRNTREWIKINDNSKSYLHREKFIAEHGGEFIKNGSSWVWQIYIVVVRKIVNHYMSLRTKMA